MNTLVEKIYHSKIARTAAAVALFGGMTFFSQPTYAQQQKHEQKRDGVECMVESRNPQMQHLKQQLYEAGSEIRKGRNEIYKGMNDIRQGRMQMMQEVQKHMKPGYIEIQRGDYIVGKIVTPGEIISYRFHKGGAKNKEMKEFLKKIESIKKQNNLQKYDQKEFGFDRERMQQQKQRFRQELDGFLKDMGKVHGDLEKKLESLEQLKDIDMDHEKMQEHFKQYGEMMKQRAGEWKKYSEKFDGKKPEEVRKQFQEHPAMKEWMGKIEQWKSSDMRKWQNDVREYVRNNVERKMFSDGEFYIKIKRFEKDFPLPPQLPKAPMHPDALHKHK